MTTEKLSVTARQAAPKVSAAIVAAAAARLAGTIVLDLADRLVGPALYDARLEFFRTMDGEDLGEDDGTLVVLAFPGEAMDLIHTHGSAGKAAAALNARLREEFAAV